MQLGPQRTKSSTSRSIAVEHDNYMIATQQVRHEATRDGPLEPHVFLEFSHTIDLQEFLPSDRAVAGAPLAVMSQQVVVVDAESADGWRQAKTTMGSMPVVLVQPAGELLAALV